MIVYHGTTEASGSQIMKDGIIKNDIKRRYGQSFGLPTTNGYVYITNNFVNAVYYGNKNAYFDKQDNLIVFKFQIDENILEADNDEIEYTLKPFGNDNVIKDKNNPTVEESLKHTMSARIPNNIYLVNNVEYAVIPSTYSKNRNETRDIVSLARTDNEYANKLKDEFLKSIIWNKCY